MRCVAQSLLSQHNVPKLLHSCLDYVTAHECSSMMKLLFKLLSDTHCADVFSSQFVQARDALQARLKLLCDPAGVLCPPCERSC